MVDTGHSGGTLKLIKLDCRYSLGVLQCLPETGLLHLEPGEHTLHLLGEDDRERYS